MNTAIAIEFSDEKILVILLLFVDFQAEWSVPVILVLGPSDGISYRTQNSMKVSSYDK